MQKIDTKISTKLVNDSFQSTDKRLTLQLQKIKEHLYADFQLPVNSVVNTGLQKTCITNTLYILVYKFDI